MNLNDLLEEISVIDPYQWENEMSDSAIQSWHAVTDETGIIAYFGKETDAFRFRLSLINARLNPAS